MLLVLGNIVDLHYFRVKKELDIGLVSYHIVPLPVKKPFFK